MNHDDLGNYSHAEVAALKRRLAELEAALASSGVASPLDSTAPGWSPEVLHAMHGSPLVPVLPGWRLVPETPTDAMLAAAIGELAEPYSGRARRHYELVWQAMVKAAPGDGDQ